METKGKLGWQEEGSPSYNVSHAALAGLVDGMVFKLENEPNVSYKAGDLAKAIRNTLENARKKSLTPG